MKIKEKFKISLLVLTTFILFGGSVLFLVYVNRSVTEKRNLELNRYLKSVESTIINKMNEGVDLLYDLRGLLKLDKGDAKKWEDYVTALSSEHKWLNTYSVAYVEKIRREDISKFEKTMRDIGDSRYKNYTVFPTIESVTAYPIRYLHTNDAEVSYLLGFDFQYSEKTMKAFKSATLTNKPTISELTHLNLVLPSSKKTGYEVILPVYSISEIETISPELRENHLLGFIGAWLEPKLLTENSPKLTGVRYSLYDDVEEVFASGLLKSNPNATVSSEFEVLNHKFKIVMESNIMFRLTSFDENIFGRSLIVIILINLLWIMSVYSILSSRKRALDMASLVTKDLRKFKLAVDGVSDHVVITDPEGVVIYANKAVMAITGYSIEEIIDNRPSLWGGRMSRDYYEKFWKTIKLDKKPFWGELTNRRKNGELYEAELHVSPILDEGGNILFFVGIERDISRMKAVDRMKTEFISLASHQLRTPLSAVKWFGEMLMDGDAGKLTKMQEKYVTKINESNEREIQLVNALLNVSRIESGKIVVSPKPTDLRKMVEGILSDMQVNIAGENKILQYTIDKNVPEVVIDADLIKHVYTNLLSNALKYTNEGGKIVVKIYLRGNSVITEVKDNGIGIPKGEQKRITEKFFRGSNALKKATEGNGLGLYLAKTIIESSGGKIWFESIVGKGTTFKFSLPIRAIRRKKKSVN
ncbi:MAG: signal transduction histidine kinase [uncultured bacterium]|uniref:histidine kinase n=1 Tax=Candidatus Collierbacteria bacterium GW2011_GWC2_44_18 TaxID=1618392 RepID=A0A0G1HPQ5_9BACT|nr:MAG: signal transduction histidine kinase [uncultured bacterium]KKT30274.1 MAG: NarL family signal transduction histidine kinase [Microgenomates group bacterium GW2011_GWC1_44_10]KKT48618.1 MAG: NarL family signal transduction histidine kinase [Candidatus Collierbacteria bacterium GW2011_GWC2_44_18]